eukprot:6467572-Amphidinium_carterae.1
MTLSKRHTRTWHRSTNTFWGRCAVCCDRNKHLLRRSDVLSPQIPKNPDTTKVTHASSTFLTQAR